VQPESSDSKPASDLPPAILAPPPGIWSRLRKTYAAVSESRFADRFIATYLTADARSLAAGRIVLASVLLLDLFKRWVVIGDWYTNDGLVPNHTLLWRPSFPHVFSFFYMASYLHEAVIGFVICAIVYTMLLFGIFTRLAQVLSMVAVMSLHGRLLLFDNGGDVVLGLLAMWTAFLPTGSRYSVDAVLGRGQPAHPRITRLGVLALTCQLAFIYFFNAVHKNGETWREGTAVHYVLHLDRLATPLAVWMRARMTPGLSKVMSWSALGIEWALPLLLLSPVATRYCRRVAIAFVIMLHVSFGVFLNVGNFVPAMIAYTPNFISGEDWDAFERWWHRSRFAAPAVALEARIAALIRRAGAFFSLGRTARLVLPGPAVTVLLARLPFLREISCAFFIFIAANQLLDENQAAHQVWDHHNALPVAAAVTYLNLFQGWSMFAPEVSKTDLNVSVEAITVRGRHVDPWNEAANPTHPKPGGTIPPVLGPSWLYYQYVTRIPGWPAYNQAFQEWILRYPQRTGRKDDEIVSFKVWKVEDDSPLPGKTEPTNQRTTLMFQYPPNLIDNPTLLD
jgi:hypothetical protein